MNCHGARNATTNFYATATDAVGNVSACSSPAFVYVSDSTAPTATITFPAASGAYNSGSWNTFAGTAADTLSGVADVQYSVQRTIGQPVLERHDVRAAAPSEVRCVRDDDLDGPVRLRELPCDGGSTRCGSYGTDAAGNISTATSRVFTRRHREPLGVVDHAGWFDAHQCRPLCSSSSRFNESVTGVDASDFALAATGSVAGASITTVPAGPSATLHGHGATPEPVTAPSA